MSIVVGEVIAVTGTTISLRIFEDSNQETLFLNGEKYRGVSLREHISIQRGFIDIVCLIEGEFLDERRVTSDGSEVFYVRRVDVKPIGFLSGGEFNEGVKFLPMIRDKATLLSEATVAKIYGTSSEDGSSFSIGRMLKEDVVIGLPWNRLFNSHLGIFGNTGSGKSNTLAKLFTSLFELKRAALEGKSCFVIIDFNGEYISNQLLPADDKLVTVLDQRNVIDRLPIEADHFWDAEILSLLFQATANTQQPFLRRVVSGRDRNRNNPNALDGYIYTTFKKVFAAAEAKGEALELAREIARLIGDDDLEQCLSRINYYVRDKYFKDIDGTYYNADGVGFENIIAPLLEEISLDDTDHFDEFLLRAYLQLCSDVTLGYAQFEHIQPVLTRARSSLEGLRSVLEIVDETPHQPLLHVISLKKCKSDMKKILPLLIAKNAYINHKNLATSPPDRTLHIIVDEAHNILSEQSNREHEVWKDYRLELFEEIIKEGRKFGVYLTLASQRPADISPTIISQIHNFFIHRLVNERDLQLMDNAISTLDASSRALIPTLAKGCCVVTGTAFDLPMILRVDPLMDEQRPSSDDVDLLELWN